MPNIKSFFYYHISRPTRHWFIRVFFPILTALACLIIFHRFNLQEIQSVRSHNRITAFLIAFIVRNYRTTHAAFVCCDELRLIGRTILFRNSLLNQQRFNGLKGKFKGQRCVILDNLSDIDLVAITDEFSIGTGDSFLQTQKAGFVPSIIIVSDKDMIKKYGSELLKIEDSDIFLPVSVYGILPEKENIYYLNMQKDADYSDEMVRYISISKGDLYAAQQIADFFGFEKDAPKAEMRLLPKMLNEDNQAEKIIVSINPNLTVLNGHCWPLDDILFSESLNRGWSCASFSFKDCAEGIIGKNHQVWPAFSVGVVKTASLSSEDSKIFFKELSSGLGKIRDIYGAKTPIRLFMYTGSPSTIRVILKHIEKDPYLTADMHLFYNSFPDEFWTEDQYNNLWNLDGIEHDRLRLYAGVPSLKNILEQNRLDTELLPYFSTTFKDSEIEVFHKDVAKRKEKTFVNVLFPGTLRVKEGDETLPIAIQQIVNNIGGKKKFKITVRVSESDYMTINSLKKISEENIRIITGVLLSDDYKTMIKSADIIVNIYSGKEFANRPSGVFADSMLLGIPIIASINSSMGQEIMHLKNGTVFDDDNAKSLAKAVETCIIDIELYQNNAQEIAKRWYPKNSWKAFMGKLN